MSYGDDAEHGHELAPQHRVRVRHEQVVDVEHDGEQHVVAAEDKDLDVGGARGEAVGRPPRASLSCGAAGFFAPEMARIWMTPSSS